jgi:hypothetical protein
VYRDGEDALIRPVASGEPGRPITVLAERAGAVVLSGRWAAPEWQVMDGNPYVYYYGYRPPAGYPFEDPFQLAEEGRLLARAASLAGVDRPGRWWVDTAARRIYLRPSDDRPPAGHRIEYGTGASGIEFRGVKHWRLTGLTVTGFRATGIMIANGAGSIEIDRSEVSCIGAQRPGADPSNGYALAVYDSAGGNYFHHNNFHHTLAEVVHISQTAAPGDRWEENDLHHAGGQEWLVEGQDPRRLAGPGIILRASGAVVARNRVYANGHHGIILESDLLGREGPASPSRNLVEGNILAWNGGNGIHADGKNSSQASAANLVRLNLVERNNQDRPGSDADGEIRLTGNFDDTTLANNTIYAEQSNGVVVSARRVTMSANIVFHAAREQRTWPLRTIEPALELTLDGNDWYRPGGGGLVNWNGRVFESLEDLRRVTGQEQRGWSVDPKFVSSETGHFWLRAVSPVLGLGAFPYRPLLAVTPTELRFLGVAGGRRPAEQVVTVTSACGAPLAWVAQSSDRWLQLAAVAGRFSAAVDPTGLPPGQYSGTVQVIPALEGERAVAVRANLTLLPSPPRRRFD